MNIKAAYSKEKSQTAGASGGGNSIYFVLVSQKGHSEGRQLWPIPLAGPTAISDSLWAHLYI